MSAHRVTVASAVAICVAISAAPSTAAVAAPPLSQLAARRNDVPGFNSAVRRVRSARSASGFAGLYLASPRVLAEKTALLQRQGFVEGVKDSLQTPSGEISSTAVVLGSRGAAMAQVAGWMTAYRHSLGNAAVVAPIAAIPGSQVLSVSSRSPREESAARVVTFTVGRCALVESIVYIGQGASEQIAANAQRGALALYGRARAACS
jgi:hypothetical protein